jgi:hypothetical protein
VLFFVFVDVGLMRREDGFKLEVEQPSHLPLVIREVFPLVFPAVKGEARLLLQLCKRVQERPELRRCRESGPER